MLAGSWDLSWPVGCNTSTWLLHVLWASLLHGGEVPRVSFLRDNEPDGSHFTFYDMISEVVQCYFHCFYSGAGMEPAS